MLVYLLHILEGKKM